MNKRIIPAQGWTILYPLKQDERLSNAGIILPKGVEEDELDIMRCKVMEATPYSDDRHQEIVEKDAIVIIPKLEGLGYMVDGDKFKIVKMDRIIAIEINMEKNPLQKAEAVMIKEMKDERN